MQGPRVQGEVVPLRCPTSHPQDPPTDKVLSKGSIIPLGKMVHPECHQAAYPSLSNDIIPSPIGHTPQVRDKDVIVSRRALAMALQLPHALLQRCLSRHEWALLIRVGMHAVAGTTEQNMEPEADQRADALDTDDGAPDRGLGRKTHGLSAEGEGAAVREEDLADDAPMAATTDQRGAPAGKIPPAKKPQLRLSSSKSCKVKTSTSAALPTAADEAFVGLYRAFLKRTIEVLMHCDDDNDRKIQQKRGNGLGMAGEGVAGGGGAVTAEGGGGGGGGGDDLAIRHPAHLMKACGLDIGTLRKASLRFCSIMSG